MMVEEGSNVLDDLFRRWAYLRAGLRGMVGRLTIPNFGATGLRGATVGTPGSADPYAGSPGIVGFGRTGAAAGAGATTGRVAAGAGAGATAGATAGRGRAATVAPGTAAAEVWCAQSCWTAPR